jgi:hypothetical protein
MPADELKGLKFEKNPGADWLIYYIDVSDGSLEVTTVFGFATAELALAEAVLDLNEGYEGAARDWFEIVAVVRDGVDLSKANTD